MALMDERRAAHKEGREEGIKEGIREGRQEGRIETFCDLVAKGVLTVAEALNLSGCTKGEFTEWMQKLHPNSKLDFPQNSKNAPEIFPGRWHRLAQEATDLTKK